MLEIPTLFFDIIRFVIFQDSPILGALVLSGVLSTLRITILRARFAKNNHFSRFRRHYVS
jgi:hypothetical protein